MNEKKLPLNSLHLKLLAMLSMLVDHMGYTLFPAAAWMRVVGRPAFPIFCFLIAEGCAHTHDRKRYAGRLLLFAVLSELPFNLMCSGRWLSRWYQNVLWTLLLGALVCWALDWALKRRRAAALLAAAAALAAGFLLGEWGETDYGGWGVLLVVLFFGVSRLPCGQPVKMAAQAAGLALFCVGCMNGRPSIELWALLSLPVLWLYNGQRGFSGRALQYGFYAFYPIHILILSVLARYVF